jgi:hypothetical protein
MCTICSGVNLLVRIVLVLPLVGDRDEALYARRCGSGKRVKTTGLLPVAKSATATCEDGINKLVGKAAACIIKCHNSRASGKLADDAAEETCEKSNAGKSCLEKFTAGVTTAQSKDTSGGCNCVNVTTLANAIESLLDIDINLLTYCASPSGAFLQ